MALLRNLLTTRMLFLYGKEHLDSETLVLAPPGLIVVKLA
jgi:hypothetical protein